MRKKPEYASFVFGIAQCSARVCRNDRIRTEKKTYIKLNCINNCVFCCQYPERTSVIIHLLDRSQKI